VLSDQVEWMERVTPEDVASSSDRINLCHYSCGLNHPPLLAKTLAMYPRSSGTRQMVTAKANVKTNAIRASILPSPPSGLNPNNCSIQSINGLLVRVNHAQFGMGYAAHTVTDAASHGGRGRRSVVSRTAWLHSSEPVAKSIA
jgi:hypothetical protein